MVTAIVEILESRRFHFGNEDDLQAALAAALVDAGYDVEREVRLDSRSRIDLLTEGVGIEVKVAGSAREVRAQLERYAAAEQIESLILVTARSRHRMPPRINDKPLRVVSLAAAL